MPYSPVPFLDKLRIFVLENNRLENISASFLVADSPMYEPEKSRFVKLSSGCMSIASTRSKIPFSPASGFITMWNDLTEGKRFLLNPTMSSSRFCTLKLSSVLPMLNSVKV